MYGGLRTLEIQNAKVDNIRLTEKGYVLQLDVGKAAIVTVKCDL